MSNETDESLFFQSPRGAFLFHIEYIYIFVRVLGPAVQIFRFG